MTQLTPEQALLIHNALLLPSIKVEHRITRAVIAALPDDQKDYRPNDVAKTAFDLAWHLASAEHGFRMGVINGVFDFSGLGRPDSVRTPEDVATWYAETFAKDFDQLTKLTGEQLVRVIDFRGVVQLPALSFLQTGTSHSIHHRGQLSAYLKVIGVEQPALLMR
jgi:uncharacterized damage-inducible protein DinB